MSLDLLEIAAQKIDALGVPAATISALSGVSNTDLSLFLNQQKPCPAHKATMINRAVQDLEKLVAMARPLPIDFRKAAVLRDLIEKIETDELLVFVHVKEPPLASRECFRVVRNGAYFAEEKDGKITWTKFTGPAAQLTRDAAEQVRAALANAGFPNARVISGGLTSDYVFGFSDVWKSSEPVAQTIEAL